MYGAYGCLYGTTIRRRIRTCDKSGYMWPNVSSHRPRWTVYDPSFGYGGGGCDGVFMSNGTMRLRNALSPHIGNILGL